MRFTTFKYSLLAVLIAQIYSSGALAQAGKTEETQTIIIDAEKNSTAPTVTLEATQPQSIVNQKYIEQNTAAGANYSDIVNLLPSVVSVDPNGPGLMESQSLSIRGFQDGQYNVTFDGIPWGDSNDFTHHSTVYFMPQDIGGITVDRGPGDASTIGNATFGGTIAVESKKLTDERQSKIYGSYGSWNTRLAGLEYNSGTLKDFGDAHLYFSIKDLHSDGFLTNSSQVRDNIFLKFDKSIDSDTVMTVAAMWNHTLQHVPNGSTPQQQQQYGYNLGLVKNSSSESNAAWNYDDLTSDFEYVGFKKNLGSWTLDNKTYSYAYYHTGFYGANQGSVSAVDTFNDGGTTNGANNVPGISMHNNYRSIGNLLRATDKIGNDELQVGLWVDHQIDNRFQNDVDWTLGGVPYNGESNGGSVQRDMNNTLTTIQSYAQYAWKVVPSWTITPGLKYASFARSIDAAVNQNTKVPYSGSETWTKLLPSLNTRYLINPNLSIYAQYAEGFLAPNLNVFYKTNPDLGAVKPTTTKNYQLGTNWVGTNLSLGVDVYHIDSTNISSTAACPAGYTSCASLVPGVKFNGAEIEGSYKLGNGYSLYGNMAENNYNTSDGSVLQNAPKFNTAFGIAYDKNGLYASFMTKFIGERFSNVDANGNNLHFGGYALSNIDVSYKLKELQELANGKAVVGFKINNVFDKRGNFTSLYSDINSNPLYYVVPSRSFQVNLAVPF